MCSLEDPLNFFIQYLPPYPSCLFSMLLNYNIADIQKPDGICSVTFIVNENWGFFVHPSIFSIKHGRSA